MQAVFGHSVLRMWYAMHSQQIPLRSQSAVQGHIFRFSS